MRSLANNSIKSIFSFKNNILGNLKFYEKEIKNVSNLVKLTKNEKKQTYEEKSNESEDFIIKDLDFEYDKKKEESNSKEIYPYMKKLEDNYEKVSNLKAYQSANNILIINAISRNKDIRRLLSDKTDYSEDTYSMIEPIWNNTSELGESNKIDFEELDNEKIEELMNFVKNCDLEDLTKYDSESLKLMSYTNYKKNLMEILKTLQLYQNRKFKLNSKFHNQKSEKEIENKIEKILRNDLQSDATVTKKKYIIRSTTKEYTESEFIESLNYLIQDSKIDFRQPANLTDDFVNEFVPQTKIERKRFKDIFDIKIEEYIHKI